MNVQFGKAMIVNQGGGIMPRVLEDQAVQQALEETHDDVIINVRSPYSIGITARGMSEEQLLVTIDEESAAPNIIKALKNWTQRLTGQ